MTEERTVQDSIVETVHMVRPNHMNAAGRLFGGMLMQWLDEVAGLVGKAAYQVQCHHCVGGQPEVYPRGI